jgi:hypothetical protein
MTMRQAQEIMGCRIYSCEMKQPACKAAGRCICIDFELPAREAIMCGDGVEACRCGYEAEYLCDFPMGKGKTCDAKLCESCAIPVEVSGEVLPDELTQRRDPEARALALRRSSAISDLHYCPAHAGTPKVTPT